MIVNSVTFALPKWKMGLKSEGFQRIKVERTTSNSDVVESDNTFIEWMIIDSGPAGLPEKVSCSAINFFEREENLENEESRFQTINVSWWEIEFWEELSEVWWEYTGSFKRKLRAEALSMKNYYNGEFDPGSGWTLAAGLIHASRRGSMCSNTCGRPANGCGTRMQPTFYRGIARGNLD